MPYIPSTIHTANMPFSGTVVGAPARPVFITIAQQAGGESTDLPRLLAEKLNAASSHSAHWLTWDEELIDKVSADSHIPADLIQSLETSGHSWLDDLLTGISGRPDEQLVFDRVRDAIRDLAAAGHAILIGHGSIFLTRDMPGGVNVRLIAPYELRVENIAKRFGLTPARAVKHMNQLDRQRSKFFHRFFPDLSLSPEMFDAEFNTARLKPAQIISAILGMLPA